MAGCGGSSSSSNSKTSTGGSAAQSSQGAASTRSGAGTTPPGGSEVSTTTSKPAHLPSGTVAKVDGTAISTAAYTHWLGVSAPATVRPLLANASNYSACIAAVKSREAKTEELIRSEEENIAKRSKGRLKESRPRRKPRTEAQFKEQCELQYKAFKRQAVDTLVRRAWAQVQAKELGVGVNESEVAKQVKTREANQRALAKSSRAREFDLAETPHYSQADIVEVVKSELLETGIDKKIREKFTKADSVSQSQMEKYFNEHKQIYAQPESRSIMLVSAESRGTAEAISKEHLSGGLSAGADKHGLKATASSIGCERSRGSAVRLSPIYAGICSAKTGVITGPVKMASVYYVFEVKSITPAAKPNFALEKERIKELLSAQGQEQGMLKYNEESRKKLQERTECAAGYVIELCKEYTVPKPKPVTRAKP